MGVIKMKSYKIIYRFSILTLACITFFSAHSHGSIRSFLLRKKQDFILKQKAKAVRQKLLGQQITKKTLPQKAFHHVKNKCTRHYVYSFFTGYASYYSYPLIKNWTSIQHVDKTFKETTNIGLKEIKQDSVNSMKWSWLYTGKMKNYCSKKIKPYENYFGFLGNLTGFFQ